MHDRHPGGGGPLFMETFMCAYIYIYISVGKGAGQKSRGLNAASLEGTYVARENIAGKSGTQAYHNRPPDRGFVTLKAPNILLVLLSSRLVLL